MSRPGAPVGRSASPVTTSQVPASANASVITPPVSGAHRREGADGVGYRVERSRLRPAGGESLRDFYRRVAEFADDLRLTSPRGGA